MIANKIYSLLPTRLQNFIITSYSSWIFKKKYGRTLSLPSLGPIDQSNRFEFEKSFQEFIAYAVVNVPFYNELVNRLNIEVSEINLLNYKEIFPVITKEEVRRNPERFYSVESSNKISWLFTSGTSGSPLKIKASFASRQRNYAFFQAILKQYGVELFSESATFAGRVLFSTPVNNCYWRRDGYLNTTYFSTYHMSNDSLQFYIEELERRKPLFIDSYPSSLTVLARYIIERRIKLSFTPRLILTSSESLSDSARSLIAAAFNGAPLVDHYGCTEMAAMAYSEGSGYVFPPRYGLVEFLPLEGDVSKIICTGLINEAMPLIRYDIGDICYRGVSGENFRQECEKIIGREDDVVITPTGEKIGRMDPVFKGIEGIDKAQIIQEAINKLVVKIVLQSNGKELFDQHALKSNIHERVGKDMQVKVIIVEDIPLTKSGKFRAVISTI